MKNIECPACSGPDNSMCATCNGTNEVTQEVFDTFNENKKEMEELFLLINSIEDFIRSSNTKEELVVNINELINNI
jgi:hypothetical protein